MSRDESAIRRESLETDGEALSYEMATTAARAASEMFARDVTIVDLRNLVSYTDYFVIASAETERQTRRVAQEVIQRMIEAPPAHQAHRRGHDLDQPRLPRRCRPRPHRRGPRLLPLGVLLAQRPSGALGGVDRVSMRNEKHRVDTPHRGTYTLTVAFGAVAQPGERRAGSADARNL